MWAVSGGQCGKHLVVSMRTQLDGLQRHGELVFGVDRYSPEVREELLPMSAATIDRYMAPAKAGDAIRGATTTKPSPLLRASITIRKAGDEVEAEPGFFEGDTEKTEQLHLASIPSALPDVRKGIRVKAS